MEEDDESYTLGVTEQGPRNSTTQGLGADMFHLMEFPTDDLLPIVRLLS